MQKVEDDVNKFKICKFYVQGGRCRELSGQKFFNFPQLSQAMYNRDCVALNSRVRELSRLQVYEMVS